MCQGRPHALCRTLHLPSSREHVQHRSALPAPASPPRKPNAGVIVVPTYYSQALMTPSESWRAIRSIRAEPPRSIASSLEQRDRKREFHMALEQAQQQFRAASQIDYESRPLNLFYGLAQAGRAICAASHRVGGQGQPHWRGQGHGVKFDPNCKPDMMFAQHINQDTSSSDLFTLVSHAIDSPSRFGSAPFGAVVNQLYDYTITFREAEDYPRPIADVHVSERPLPTEVEVAVPGLPNGTDITEEAVRQLLACYPALTRLPVVLNDDRTVRLSHNPGRCFVQIDRPEQLLLKGGRPHLQGTTWYRHHAMLMPTLGDAQEPTNPLMTWWLTLFALSVMARYAPSVWTRVLSLSDSQISSRIELLLDEAIGAIPELVYTELEALGTS